jgi:hypothetical protein
MTTSPPTPEVQLWSIDRLVFYARNPRKNDAAVDRMCSSIREFGFKIPVLARSNGEVVDGHLRLKAARKLGSWPGGDTTGIPVLLCDEWTPARVKAFRLMVNRSVTWAYWDEELLALELQELNEADFDLSLTGFDPKELDDLLLGPEDDEKANAVPPLPENPVSQLGDLWTCGPHRVLCADATSPEAVVRLLGERKPFLLICDPPYGIELDSEWRDRAGLNSCGTAEASYMKHRTEGHTETTISGDTRADWSEAFELDCHLVITTSTYFGSSSMPTQTRSVSSAAASVVPLPRNGSKTNSPRLMWFRIGRRMRSTGFCVGWSNFSSSDRPMMNLGDSASQIVEFSPAFPNQGAFFFRTYQQGSC